MQQKRASADGGSQVRDDRGPATAASSQGGQSHEEVPPHSNPRRSFESETAQSQGCSSDAGQTGSKWRRASAGVRRGASFAGKKQKSLTALVAELVDQGTNQSVDAATRHSIFSLARRSLGKTRARIQEAENQEGATVPRGIAFLKNLVAGNRHASSTKRIVNFLQENKDEHHTSREQQAEELDSPHGRMSCQSFSRMNSEEAELAAERKSVVSDYSELLSEAMEMAAQLNQFSDDNRRFAKTSRAIQKSFMELQNLRVATSACAFTTTEEIHRFMQECVELSKGFLTNIMDHITQMKAALESSREDYRSHLPSEKLTNLLGSLAEISDWLRGNVAYDYASILRAEMAKVALNIELGTAHTSRGPSLSSSGSLDSLSSGHEGTSVGSHAEAKDKAAEAGEDHELVSPEALSQALGDDAPQEEAFLQSYIEERHMPHAVAKTAASDVPARSVRPEMLPLEFDDSLLSVSEQAACLSNDTIDNDESLRDLLFNGVKLPPLPSSARDAAGYYERKLPPLPSSARDAAGYYESNGEDVMESLSGQEWSLLNDILHEDGQEELEPVTRASSKHGPNLSLASPSNGSLTRKYIKARTMTLRSQQIFPSTFSPKRGGRSAAFDPAKERQWNSFWGFAEANTANNAQEVSTCGVETTLPPISPRGNSKKNPSGLRDLLM